MKYIITALTLMCILLLIGVLTGSWRSAGSIVTFVYYGISIIRPHLFLIIAFLLTCLMSYALGTSFGVAGTAGVIFMTLARSGSVDPVIAAGVLLSGIYFGDRTSPASSMAFTVASVTGTDLYENVRGMLKTGFIPWMICFAVYAFLSWRNPLSAVDPAAISAFESTFSISVWTLIPAAVILIFPLLRIPIVITLLSSIPGIDARRLSVSIVESAVKTSEELCNRKICLGMSYVCSRIDEPWLAAAVYHVVARPQVAVKKSAFSLRLHFMNSF